MKKVVSIALLLSSISLMASESSSWLSRFKEAAPIGIESYAYWATLGVGSVCISDETNKIAAGTYDPMALDSHLPQAKAMVFAAIAGSAMGLMVAAVNPDRLIARKKDPRTFLSRSVAAQYAIATWGTTALVTGAYVKLFGGH